MKDTPKPYLNFPAWRAEVGITDAAYAASRADRRALLKRWTAYKAEAATPSFASRMLTAGKTLVSKLTGQPAATAPAAKREFTKAIAGILPRADAREVADGVAAMLGALDQIERLATSGDEVAAERIADGLLAQLKGAPAPKPISAAVPPKAHSPAPASAVPPVTAAVAVKTMTSAAFALLPHGARNAFIRAGGKLTESPKPQADPQERARVTNQLEARGVLRQAGIEVSDPKKLNVTAAGLAALRGSAGTFRRRLENAKNTRERLQVEDDAFAALAGKSGNAEQILRAAGVLTTKTTHNLKP